MKPHQLLKLAKAEFEKEFGKTHEEYGYPAVLPWKQKILFAPTQREISAYIKSKRVINTILCSLIFVCIISLILYFTYKEFGAHNIIVSVILAFVFSVFIILCACFYTHAFRVFKQHERICKDKVIIYKKD